MTNNQRQTKEPKQTEMNLFFQKYPKEYHEIIGPAFSVDFPLPLQNIPLKATSQPGSSIYFRSTRSRHHHSVPLHSCSDLPYPENPAQ